MDFERLINPKTYALIGATNNPLSGAYRFLQGQIANKYRGKIFPINPKYSEILGIKTYPDIRDVPEVEIDYVLIAVPAEQVPAEIRKCIEKKVKFAVIFSSGFSEIGKAQLEAEIKQIARGKIRFLGPNCIGVYSPEVRLGYFIDQPITSAEGDVSFISQSGGITRKFIWTSYSGFPVRATVSSGNTVDISISELLAYFAQDSKTQIIAAYLEFVKDGPKFLKQLKSMTSQKPVVILKCGRTPKGKVAAQSHTGAIAGSYGIFAAMVKQAGGIAVESFEELTDVVIGLKCLKGSLPLGYNIAIINTGGGIAVEITDTSEANGFNVSNLEDSTQEKLEQLLPSVNVIVKNPIDLGAAGFNPKVFGQAVQILSQDPHIDAILIVHEVERFQDLNNRFEVSDIGEIYADIMQKNRNPKKPIISILPRAWEMVDHFITYQNYSNDLLNVGVPVYPTAFRALKMLAHLIRYERFLNK
jgi:acyl-CoA synthetase (NDP forming)